MGASVLPASAADGGGSNGQVEAHAREGRIACAVGLFSSSGDICAQFAPPSADSIQVEPTARNGRIYAATYALSWEPTVPVGARTLSLSFPAADTSSYVLATSGEAGPGPWAQGTSVLTVTLLATGNEPLYELQKGQELEFTVRPARASLNQLPTDPVGLGGASGAVVDQPFMLCVTLVDHPTDSPPASSC